ncbi:MAG TPA: hypothetical protein H9816_01725 [Candidatus Tidjanibacter faecipullorum]|uniref:BACON domain-containing protein n=1 Tax=Candidatus Tidjanibacter faecipullorum TaxID=2838766 RepID=A0A9D2DD07_9BACT|nr:hypothetical protein [Candidatus Tidjanibacter faecipullorum]
MFLALCGLATLCATACSKPKTPAATITIVGKTAIEVAADAPSATVAFNVSAAWTASAEAASEWLALTPERGKSGSNTLTIALLPNTAETPRSASIHIVCANKTATVTLTQLGAQRPEPATGATVKEIHLSDTNHLLFTTDEAGRIIRVHQILGGIDTPLAEHFTDLVYSDDLLTCTNYTAGSDEKNVTRHAMQEDRVTERIEGGNYRDRFAYNPDGTLAAYTFGPGSEQVMNYQWTDGNLTQITQNQQTATIEYGTETAGIANIDLLAYIFMELLPEMSRYRLTGLTSRNLPIACSVPGTDNSKRITIAYEFGENRAVSKITINKLYGDQETTATVTLVY